jgi:tRNA pseudouridine38-40 synthase
MTPLVALWCWYHGGPFKGYQTQPGLRTVQDTVFKALAAAGLSRRPLPAGRTDAGVHARMQVLSLRLPEEVPLAELPARINAHLPEEVGIALAKSAQRGFHPQYGSKLKEYRYRLLREDDPEWAPFGWRVEVDAKKLSPLVEAMEGTRDFAAFHDRTSGRFPRTISEARVVEVGRHLEVRLKGPGFARYQVRLLVGAAVAVARGELPEAHFRAGLETAKKLGEVRAPAQGLTLWEVRYGEGDPFSESEREAAAGVPGAPPFR